MQNLTNFSHRCQTLTANQMKKISGGDNSDYSESILAIMNGPNSPDTIEKAEELWDKHCVPTGPEV